MTRTRTVSGTLGVLLAALALALVNPAPAQAVWTNYWSSGTYENVTKWTGTVAMNGGAANISVEGFVIRITTQGWGWTEGYSYTSQSYSVRTTRQYCYWNYPSGNWPGWIGMICDYSH